MIPGYIDPGLDSPHVPKGSKMELPYWLAKALCTRRKHCVTVEVPKQYKEGYREVFNADANVVDLHKLGPYFYGFGSHLLQFEHPDAPDIAKSLLKVICQHTEMYCYVCEALGKTPGIVIKI